MRKLYVSDDMKKKFEEWDKKEIVKKDDLRVENIKNGIILPLQKTEGRGNENRMLGGVVDENLNFVRLSLQKREKGESLAEKNDWYIGADINNPPKNIKKIDEEVVFIGPIKRHFAHFYLESLSRLWYVLKNQGTFKIAYLTQEGDNPVWANFDFFFEQLNVKKEDMIEIKEPTQFKNVIIPEQAFVLNGYYHQFYKDTIDKIMENIKPAKYKKVFLSKAYNYKGSNRSLGDEIAEEIFKKNGFKVFYPENMKIKEFLQIIKGADFLAAQSASNAHNAIFMRENAQLIVLNRSAHIHIIQSIINSMRKLNVTYIDTFYPIFPVDWSVGPFSCYFSKYFDDFLIDNKMKFHLSKMKKLSKENFITFVKAWGDYYSDYWVNSGILDMNFECKEILKNIKDMKF